MNRFDSVKQALTYYNVEDSPTDWARIRSNLGDAFTNCFNATGDGQMLTDAISSYEASLTIHTEKHILMIMPQQFPIWPLHMMIWPSLIVILLT